MRTSIAGLALIHRQWHGQSQWLAQWNSSWRNYHFVGGHKYAHESFRACVVRELEEELVLSHEFDISVAEEPCLATEYTAWSRSSCSPTAYTMRVYRAALLSQFARSSVVEAPENRWISRAEIHRGHTGDGRRVSPTMKRLLRLM